MSVPFWVVDMEKREKKPVVGRQQLARRQAIGSGSTSSPPPTAAAAAAAAAGMCRAACCSIGVSLSLDNFDLLSLSPADRCSERAEADGHSALTRRRSISVVVVPKMPLIFLLMRLPPRKIKTFLVSFPHPVGTLGPTNHLDIVCVLVIGFKGRTISLFFFFFPPPLREISSFYYWFRLQT